MEYGVTASADEFPIAQLVLPRVEMLVVVFFLVSQVQMLRVEPYKRQSTEKLMLLDYSVGEDS